MAGSSARFGNASINFRRFSCFVKKSKICNWSIYSLGQKIYIPLKKMSSKRRILQIYEKPHSWRMPVRQLHSYSSCSVEYHLKKVQEATNKWKHFWNNHNHDQPFCCASGAGLRTTWIVFPSENETFCKSSSSRSTRPQYNNATKKLKCMHKDSWNFLYSMVQII